IAAAVRRADRQPRLGDPRGDHGAVPRAARRGQHDPDRDPRGGDRGALSARDPAGGRQDRQRRAQAHPGGVVTARLPRTAALAALAALAAGCHAAARHPVPGHSAARTTVHPGQLTERVVLTGALHPTRAIDVVAPANDATSLTLRWLAPDGATVKAGDRLFVLDGAGLAAALTDARHQLATVQAQLRVLERNDAVELASRRLAVRDAEVARDKARLRDGLPEDLVTR